MQQFQQPNNPQTQGPSTINERMADLKRIFDGNPQGLMNQLMRTNPQFAQFVAQNRGKTPEQAFRDNGIDLAKVRSLM